MNPDPNTPINPNENPPVSPANDATPSFSSPAPAPAPAPAPTPEVAPVAEPAPVQPGAPEQPYAPEPQVQPQANPFAASQPQSPFAQAQPTMPMSSPAPARSNKKLIIIIAVVVVLLLAAGVTAWALTRDDSKDEKADANTSVVQDDTDTVDTQEATEELPVATGAQPVNKKIEDATMGYSMNVLTVQRNLDIKPDAKYVAFEGKVFVGVEVEADITNRKYSGAVSDGSFRLVDASGKAVINSNSVLDANIQQLGLKPFKGATSSNLVDKGVLVFAVDPAQIGSLKLRYSRSAATQLGNGAQIPAEQIDVDL